MKSEYGMEVKTMSIDVDWDNDDKTVIHVTFPPEWTWGEFFELDQRTVEMLDTVKHRVLFLADVSQTTQLPTGLNLSIIRQVIDFRHDNSDLLVIVGMNTMIRALFDIVILALGRIGTSIKTADTLDEGYRLVRYRLLEIERGGG